MLKPACRVLHAFLLCRRLTQARRLEGELEVKLQALTKLCSGLETSYRSRSETPGLGPEQVGVHRSANSGAVNRQRDGAATGVGRWQRVTSRSGVDGCVEFDAVVTSGQQRVEAKGQRSVDQDG